MVAKHEGLEEPGRVREVPLGGRGVGEWLDRCVGIGQRRREVEGQAAGRGKAIRERRLTGG